MICSNAEISFFISTAMISECDGHSKKRQTIKSYKILISCIEAVLGFACTDGNDIIIQIYPDAVRCIGMQYGRKEALK